MMMNSTTKSRSRTASHAIASPPSAQAKLQPAFQPIADLQSGRIVGFEALARFHVGDQIIGPATILPHFDHNDRLALFCRMVERGLALTCEPWWPGPDVYVSVNVEVGLILSKGFCDVLDHVLEKCGGAPGQLVIEILEGERVDDHRRMAEVLTAIHRMGVSVALDDIGSGYSSLINLQQLPVDLIKLDQSFAINLNRRPEDLLFILMLVNLARGLGKRLVIEGVETREAMDALTIIGADLAQGYAIARGMAADAIGPWLARREVFGAHRTPQSMLGVYASHLTVVETCRMLQLQPLEIEWKDAARDWHSCQIGRFFSQANLHESGCGVAHRRFHDVLACYGTDRVAWDRAAANFRDELVKVIVA